MYLLEVYLSGSNPSPSWFGGTCGSGSRDGRSWSWSHPQKKNGRTNCKRKQIRAKRNWVRLANFTWCRRSELNINLNSWNAPHTNLHRFLSCGDRKNLVSCTFNVQQTLPLKFFLSTDLSWVGRSKETSSNQSQGTLNQKKGKEGALLQHQGANYKMIVKSEPRQRRVRVQLFCNFHCDKHVCIHPKHTFFPYQICKRGQGVSKTESKIWM